MVLGILCPSSKCHTSFICCNKPASLWASCHVSLGRDYQKRQEATVQLWLYILTDHRIVQLLVSPWSLRRDRRNLKNTITFGKTQLNLDLNRNYSVTNCLYLVDGKGLEFERCKLQVLQGSLPE